MEFIGQQQIMRELGIHLPKIVMDRGYNPAFLLFGKSGHGKTDMALKMANYITKGNFLLLIEEDSAKAVEKILNSRVRVVILDEIHFMKNPEILYPILDKRNRVYIGTTNQGHLLKEALVRRFIRLEFQPYSQKELEEIVFVKFPLLRKMDLECAKIIVDASNGSPAVVEQICNRLRAVFLGRTIVTPNDISIAITEVLNIKDGLSPMAQEYMQALNRLGTASLDTISGIIGISRDLIKFEIEPVLLYRGLIKITSRGRSIVI